MSEYIVKCNEVVGISGKALIVPDYIDTSKEIVRCRDCREYNPELYRHISCELLGRYVEPDDFCSWSCRRLDKE